MKTTNQPTCQSYFAAANGYSGFRSYFKKVFDPREFKRLFILKGGPGTGKNTLMRGVYAKFKDKVISSDLIYCSSDAASLDGVILKSENGRVAVIDGTSPHMTDPIYPGCTDEIINLGEFWKKEELLLNREKIEELTCEKAEAYKRAYSFLKLAGECAFEIDKIIERAFPYNELPVTKVKGESSGKLIDSFGKNGEYQLNPTCLSAEKIIGVVGLWNSGNIYIERICTMYSSDDTIIYPSALSDSKIKAVYIKSEDTAYISNPSDETNLSSRIDVSDMLDSNIIKANSSYLEKLGAIKEALLWNSADEFKKASDKHFMLEDIYKKSMDFTSLDSVKESLYERIYTLLF